MSDIRGRVREALLLLCLLLLPLAAAAQGLDGTHRFDEAFREWARTHPPRFEALPQPEAADDETGRLGACPRNTRPRLREGRGPGLSGDRIGRAADRSMAANPAEWRAGDMPHAPRRVRRPRSEQVGDPIGFWTANLVTNSFDRLEATLMLVGSNCRIYVEKGRTVASATLETLARQFDTRIVPAVRSLCGSERTPGIDGDQRLTLLLLDIRDGIAARSGPYVAGYFYPGDQYPEGKLPPNIPGHSNQRDMLYLDIAQGDPESPAFVGVMAHELQHLIHFHHDPTETTWLNEACSQAAARAIGSVSPRQIAAFVATPDNSLVGWKDEHPLANYGQATLWMAYLLQREAAAKVPARDGQYPLRATDGAFGAGVPARDGQYPLRATDGAFGAGASGSGNLVRDLVADPRHGVESLHPLLAARGLVMTDLFADFIVALTWNEPTLGSGTLALPPDFATVRVPAQKSAQAFPAEITGDLHLWSGETIRLELGAARRRLGLRLSAECRVHEQDLTGLEMLLCWEAGGKPVPGKLGRVPMVPHAYAGFQGGEIELDVPDGVDALSVMLVSWVPPRVPDFLYARQKALWYRLEVKTSGELVNPPAVVAPPSVPATPSAELGRSLAAAWTATAETLDRAGEGAGNLQFGDRLADLEAQMSRWAAGCLAAGQEPDLASLGLPGEGSPDRVAAAARRLQAVLAGQITAARLHERP